MEKLISKQKFVNEGKKILRECRGRRLALLGSVNSLQNSNTGYYVASESSKDRYYFVEYKTDSNFCTCWDYASNRSDKCKHLYAVQYAIHLGLVQEIDHKLPISQKTEKFSVFSDKPKSTIAEQYKNLSIATLNEMEKAEIEAEAYRTKRGHKWEDDTYDY